MKPRSRNYSDEVVQATASWNSQVLVMTDIARLIFSLIFLVGSVTDAFGYGAPVEGSSDRSLANSSQRLPDVVGSGFFAPNLGQADRSIKFYSKAKDSTLLIANDQFILITKGITGTGEVGKTELKWQPVGSSALGRLSPLHLLPGRLNYYIGNDPRKWRTNVPTYSAVAYKDLYPGTDLVFYSTNGDFEYDFVIGPGGKPEKICIRIEGARNISLDTNGDLVLTTKTGTIRQRKPHAYQQIGSSRRRIRAGYALSGSNRISFELGPYKPNFPLVIDPVLAFSTYLGGKRLEDVAGISVDSSGYIYVAGATESVDFPTAAPVQPDKESIEDAFVAKIDPVSGTLIYSTFLGGNFGDAVYGIAADSSGNAYVAGGTFSTDFPVLNAFQPKNKGDQDAFLTKLNSQGALVYSTYFGGSGNDLAFGIALDRHRQPHLTGLTESKKFPVYLATQKRANGPRQAFVSKFDRTASHLLFSTYFGGSSSDYATGIAVDRGGKIYITGRPFSTDLPMVNAFQNTARGIDVFLTAINPKTSKIVYSTYYGGSGGEDAWRVAVTPRGKAIIVGLTNSHDLPTTAGVIKPSHTLLEGNNGFIAKFRRNGSLVFSTYFGGTSGSGVLSVSMLAFHEMSLGGEWRRLDSGMRAA